MKQLGHFSQEEAPLVSIEASIYETRLGFVESGVHSLAFDSGETLKVKVKFLVNVDEFEVKEEDEDKVTLEVHTHGTFQFLDKSNEVLFDGEWEGDVEKTRVTIYNNIVVGLKVPAVYTGVGKNEYAGHVISGKIETNLTGFDASGLGIFKAKGNGAIRLGN